MTFGQPERTVTTTVVGSRALMDWSDRWMAFILFFKGCDKLREVFLSIDGISATALEADFVVEDSAMFFDWGNFANGRSVVGLGAGLEFLEVFSDEFLVLLGVHFSIGQMGLRESLELFGRAVE